MFFDTVALWRKILFSKRASMGFTSLSKKGGAPSSAPGPLPDGSGAAPGAWAALLLPLVLAAPAFAAEAPKPASPEPLLPAWLETVSVDGFLEGGAVINPAMPWNKINWAHYYTDRANTPQFNQGVLTIQRPLDSDRNGVSFGFKFEGVAGTDLRYSSFLGETEYLIDSRTQLGVLEANALVHLPILTSGGMDVKVGQFFTYNGAEVFNAKDNLFYTHSFSYNFGPFFHTGVMTQTQMNDWLNVYVGATTGVDTTFGWPGDNNNSPSLHGGFSAALLDGTFTITAITHSGPENPSTKDPLRVGYPNGVIGGIPAACVCAPSSTWRYYNNVVLQWKAAEDLTFSADVSYYREDGWNPASVTGLPTAALDALASIYGFDPARVPQRAKGASSYGVAGYASYKYSDELKLNARLEFWRDNNNFFAAAFPGYFDNANSLHGFPAPRVITRPAGQGTSYYEMTLGATFSPKFEKTPWFSELILRPEIRWDSAIGGAAPFFGPTPGQSRRSQTLLSMDVILPFSVR